MDATIVVTYGKDAITLTDDFDSLRKIMQAYTYLKMGLSGDITKSEIFKTE